MHRIEPRLSEHPTGPFREKEKNAKLMEFIGQLCADLREMTISKSNSATIEQTIRDARNRIQALADSKDKMDEAMRLLTRILDRTYLHHLKKEQQEFFCRCLLKVMRESDFSATVYLHMRAVAHTKA